MSSTALLQHSFSGMKILIIEDDPLLEKALEVRLKESGHNIFLAGNGKEALSVLEEHKGMDVLLCDILMPELSGPSFLWEIRSLIRDQQMAVIIISALSDGESFIKKLEVEYDYYLPKPFTLRQLLSILKEISEQKTNR